MQRYIMIRLLTGLVTLVGVSMIIFIILRIVPGDPAIVVLQQKYGENFEQFVTADQIRDERARIGADRPLPTQYLSWVGGMLRGDFGRSFLTDEPISHEIAKAFPFTFQVIIFAILIGVFVGVTLGVVAAVKQYTVWDYSARVWTILGISMPAFFTATLLIYGLLKFGGWLPPLGFALLWEDPLKAVQQIIWPALVLSFGNAAVKARLTRSQMLEILREDYVRTAYAKGLSNRVVWIRHALRNAMLPVITIVGSQIAHLMAGAVIIETIFNIPGMGVKLVDSIRLRDYLVTQDMILILAFFVILANLIVDLSYAVFDPRIRLR